MSINDFWNSTIGEIALTIKVHNELEEARTKEVLANNYSLACQIASFVNKSMNGKDIPSIYELYPDIFEAPVINAEIYKAQFMAYAEAHNKQKGRVT